MSKNVIRVACWLLAVIMMISIIVPSVITVFATDTSATSQTGDTQQDEQADESEEQEEQMSQSEALNQMNELEDQLKEVKDSIENLEGDIAEKENVQAYYEQEVSIIANQIELLKTDIATQETSLEQKQVELETKVLQLADTKKLFEDRLAAMYMMRDDSELSTLLGATDYSQAMRYSENLQQISISDTDLMDQLRVEQADLETQAADIQIRIDELNATRATLDSKSTEYANALQNVNTELTQSQATLQSQETAYGELTELFKQAQETWLSFAAPGNVDFVYDGGVFSWPLPGYFRISSDYNVERWIYGVYDVHRGIDMPAPAGTPVYASADGVVSTDAHWSYGTVVKIDHGSGLVSLYAHLSARYVNAGDYVQKGDVIGAVGSTGNSTGNHLHYEVNLNSATVNPRVYLDPSVVAQLYY